MHLSVALMVKNEEKYLEQCIKSIIPFIPFLQLVILDTGSSDKTVEIAQKYTKHVYHQDWKNDFSLHRNKSFSYCTGDWIMQIDADEQLNFLKDGSAELLLNFLDKLPDTIHAVGLPLKDWRESEKKYAAEFDVIRIFRRGKIKWKRRIHNEAIYHGESAYFPLAFLKHFGYDLTKDQKIAKAKRTVTLLKESLEQDPSDYESYFYLAQAYTAWLEDEDKALEAANKYIDFKALLGNKFNASIYHLASGIYLKRGDVENAEKWVNLGLQDDPENIDICYDLMMLGLKKDNPGYVAVGAQRYVESLEKFQQNRLKTAGRFFFTNNAICYGTALHYLTTALFERATIGYSKLMHILPQCSPEMQNEVKTKITEFINTMGWKKINESRIITPDDFRRNTNAPRQPRIAVQKPGIIANSV